MLPAPGSPGSRGCARGARVDDDGLTAAGGSSLTARRPRPVADRRENLAHVARLSATPPARRRMPTSAGGARGRPVRGSVADPSAAGAEPVGAAGAVGAPGAGGGFFGGLGGGGG